MILLCARTLIRGAYDFNPKRMTINKQTSRKKLRSHKTELSLSIYIVHGWVNGKSGHDSSAVSALVLSMRL